MFRTAEEMVTEFRDRMRGGQGTIVIKHLFQAEDLKSKIRLVAEITLPVGGSIGLHQHDQEEEIFYFISGRGEVDDAGTKRSVKPGDALLTGDGAGHAVVNTGAEPLLLLAVIVLY